MKFHIHEKIEKAETLPASFYREESIFELLRTRVFGRSWNFSGEVPSSQENTIHPLNILEGFLQEPMILTKDESDRWKCLSNVCTHRANLLTQEPRRSRSIICPYHGRQFDLDGKFKSMPEFEQAEDFPRDCDHLKEFSLERWNNFYFTSVNPTFKLEKLLQPMEERIGFLPLGDFKFRSELSKSYLVNAHWALYCDNYLEGFHIPFVHKDLNAALDYSKYTTLLFDYCNLQIGYSSGGEEVFDLPKNHVDAGKKIAAYYFWLFPNMMFNFYPWGLSINVVVPITRDKTKVNFLTYVYDESKLERGAGALLDKVEREDEYVVEAVHKGLQSSAYTTGRFSPSREKGVHHFHRLLAQFVSD